MAKSKKSKGNPFATKKSSVAVVVWDASGAPIQDSVAEAIADSVTAAAKEHNYFVSVTRG